jgi:hypothetical protein
MNLIGIKSRKASEKKVDIDTKNKVLNFMLNYSIKKINQF